MALKMCPNNYKFYIELCELLPIKEARKVLN